MKLFSSILLIAFCAASNCMEAPPSKASSTLSIISQRIGTLDTFCETTAQLLQNDTSLAQVAFTLRGRNTKYLNHWAGPRAYVNNCFLAHIKNLKVSLDMTDKDQENALHILYAFAISQLKELHKKQNKTDIGNPKLYIDTIVETNRYEKQLFDYFEFEFVENWFRVGNGYETVYLLNDSSETDSLCEKCLLPISIITIKSKENLKVENTFCEENQWTQLVEEHEVSTMPVPAVAAPVKAAFPRLIRSVSVPKIRKSSRIKKSQCQSGACPIHKKDHK